MNSHKILPFFLYRFFSWLGQQRFDFLSPTHLLKVAESEEHDVFVTADTKTEYFYRMYNRIRGGEAGQMEG